MKKTILITGTSSGIGYSIAKEFSEANYKVIATIRKVVVGMKIKNHSNGVVFC